MDAELGNFIEVCVMVLLPIGFTLLAIGNRFDGMSFGAFKKEVLNG